MKVCQIGLGSWGKNHARVWDTLLQEGYIDELYFYDLDHSLAENFSNRYQATAIKSLEGNDFDAVDVVVPAHLHYSVAKPFVERGINTFIEKPFTDNLSDAQDLIDIASNPDTQIMVGHIFRYHVGVDLAKQLIEQGAIGDIQKLEIRRLAFRNPRKDNGVIFSLAIHDLDLFSYFNDEKNPNTISAILSTIKGPTEDHAFIKLDYDSKTAIAEETWMSPSTGKVRTCKIQGSEGEIEFDFSNPNEVIVYNKYFDRNNIIVDNGNFTRRTQFVEPLMAELRDFAVRTSENKPYKTGPEIGLRAVKMCETTIKSGKEGRLLEFA